MENFEGMNKASQAEEERRMNDDPVGTEDNLPKKPKNIPTAVFILILLVGFMCVAGTGVWLEAKYNDCATQLNNCTDTCLAIQQESFEGGKWYDKYTTGS